MQIVFKKVFWNASYIVCPHQNHLQSRIFAKKAIWQYLYSILTKVHLQDKLCYLIVGCFNLAILCRIALFLSRFTIRQTSCGMS